MSLTREEQDNTIKEFKDNLDLIDKSIEEVANDLNTFPKYISDLLELRARRIEDPWILRNYLLDELKVNSIDPIPFTALKGDWHHYWFLDANYIDNGKIE